ncbi:MAG: Abi-alpha family protein [Lachnospiraceae bacterium]|nr:Abi-alpha family protein [Lachnospiraceae bacterium]
MEDDKNINVSLIPKFADTVLENMLDEPSKNIGNTFSDIWYLVLGGSIHQKAQKRKMKYAFEMEKYREQIEKEISKIPDDKRTEIDIQIIGTILEKSKYCVEKETIRSMYAKLIASSIDSERSSFVHPLFVDIISNMSECDARVFHCIAQKRKCDFLSKQDLSFSIFSLKQLGLIYIPDMDFIEKVPQDETTWLRLNLNKLFDDITPYQIENRNKDLLFKSIRDNPGFACLDCKLSELGIAFRNICM